MQPRCLAETRSDSRGVAVFGGAESLLCGEVHSHRGVNTGHADPQALPDRKQLLLRDRLPLGIKHDCRILQDQAQQVAGGAPVRRDVSRPPHRLRHQQQRRDRLRQH